MLRTTDLHRSHTVGAGDVKGRQMWIHPLQVLSEEKQESEGKRSGYESTCAGLLQ